MDRKQGIIRLGRSKSPNQSRQKRALPHQRNDSFSTSRNTWERDPLQESMNFNQTFSDSAELKINRTETFKGAQTFSGFFPPSPENVLQRVIIKENIRAPPNIQLTTKSPPNLINVGQTSFKSENHEVNQNSTPLISERESQLQRKVKVLQGRVQELHNQKQASVIHSHEQNKRLCIKNQSLQSQISKIQAKKNEEIFALREEVQKLKMRPINLKGSTFTDKLSQSQIGKVSALNTDYESKIKFLEEQNFHLKESLEQKTLSIANSSTINTQTINDYQSRINSLLVEINNYRKTQEDTSKIKKQLQFSQKSSQDYVSRLLKKSKQLTNKQMQCKQLEKSLSQALNEGNQCQLEKIQETNRLSFEEKDKELSIVKNQCAELRKQLESLDCLPQNNESQKLSQLAKQINQKEENLLEANKIIKQLEQKIEKLSQKPQTVKREPTKSSSKLKSKTYSRAL